MDKVVLMGRLTRDPEVRYPQDGRSTVIARYTLAVDRRGHRSQDGGSDQRTADFINIVTSDRAGKSVEKYFRQGMGVLVSGRTQTGGYTNKDGQKAYTANVIIDGRELADSKSAIGEGGGGSYQPASRPTPTNVIGDGFMNTPDGAEDESLPFN